MRGNHDGRGHHNKRGYHNGGYNRAPVFQSALTTATPGEALKKMSADAPAVSKDGKQYFVRASVRDINGNTLYQSSLSTTTPKEALAKMAGDAPAAASGSAAGGHGLQRHRQNHPAEKTDPATAGKRVAHRAGQTHAS
ncbi:TPA: hypothetical protein ACILHV_004969, partial [Escherichia coli]